MIGRPYHVVQKGWGREVWLANGPAYCGKLLKFMPGRKCSYHYHPRKLETLYVLEGRFTVSLADPGGVPIPHVMEVGDLITIQPYQQHGFCNIGDTAGVLLEISTQHFEDDSVRLVEGD